MIVFVFVLIAPGFMMGVIAGDRRVMGEDASSSAWKIAYWTSLLFVVSLGIIFLAHQFEQQALSSEDDHLASRTEPKDALLGEHINSTI